MSTPASLFNTQLSQAIAKDSLALGVLCSAPILDGSSECMLQPCLWAHHMTTQRQCISWPAAFRWVPILTAAVRGDLVFTPSWKLVFQLTVPQVSYQDMVPQHTPPHSYMSLSSVINLPPSVICFSIIT